jgi:hypothetical protein
VAIEAARLLTNLLPSEIRPTNRSGLCNRRYAFIAPECFNLTKCLNRYRFRIIRDASDPEKKADKTSIRTSVPSNTLKGISFKENLLYGYENSSSLYEENFLSSLNINHSIIYA